MTALLVNRSFQVFVTILAAIGTIAALIATGAIDSATGTPMLYAVVGVGIGVPLTPTSAPATGGGAVPLDSTTKGLL